MKIKIKKNNHYPSIFKLGIRPIWVKKNRRTIRKSRFMFTESCLFDLKDENQHDVNKLFGFSIGHHHKNNSFRIGWRPDLETKKIEIVAYEYHNGQRQKTIPMGLVNINEWYCCKIVYIPTNKIICYHFGNLAVFNSLCLKCKYGLGYTLGVYFGGNKKAPHDIIIYKTNIYYEYSKTN